MRQLPLSPIPPLKRNSSIVLPKWGSTLMNNHEKFPLEKDLQGRPVLHLEFNGCKVEAVFACDPNPKIEERFKRTLMDSYLAFLNSANL